MPEGLQVEQEPVEQTIELFSRCVYLLQLTAQTDWLQLDLTVPQIKVLFVLYWQDTLTVSELAEQLRVGQPTASHLVDRLVQAGCVQRQENPADRRYTLVQLTTQGRDMLERLRQGRVETLQHCLHLLTSSELLAVQQGLQILMEALEALSRLPLSRQEHHCQ